MKKLISSDTASLRDFWDLHGLLHIVEFFNEIGLLSFCQKFTIKT